MPHDIVWKGAGIEYCFYGALSFEENAAANASFFNDPRSDNVRYMISDMRQLEEIEMEQLHVEMVAATDAAQSRSVPGVRVAIVLADERLFEIVECYVQIVNMGDWTARIFYDMEEARYWAENSSDRDAARA